MLCSARRAVNCKGRWRMHFAWDQRGCSTLCALALTCLMSHSAVCAAAASLGCTHFIVGRDMAGSKSSITGEDFYGMYDAQVSQWVRAGGQEGAGTGSCRLLCWQLVRHTQQQLARCGHLTDAQDRLLLWVSEGWRAFLGDAAIGLLTWAHADLK